MEPEIIVSADSLKKHYPVKQGFFSTILSRDPLSVKAVDGINIFVRKGEVLGLVGESGSGKTTTGKLLLRLIDATSGKILYKSKDITHLTTREMKTLRREMQIIFQDPFESLDPRMLIKDIVAEPIRIQRVAKSSEEVTERVKQILNEVELTPPEEFMQRYPHELSGGQRQRVAVARAFVLDPQFVVADEPVSMLDVSIRAEILNLMLNLVQKRGTSFLYVTHDLALARHMCDRVVVMYLGKVVEVGDTPTVINNSLHPYTNALIAAVPVPDPSSKRTGQVIGGEIPSPIDPPSGCRFHTRCPYAHTRCTIEDPPLVEVEKQHWVACHLVGIENAPQDRTSHDVVPSSNSQNAVSTT